MVPLSEDSALVYGARKDCFVIMRRAVEEGSATLESILGDEGDPDYPRLVEAGIFIDDDMDEVGELRSRIARVDEDTSEYQLHINPTLDCNFRCWYCYEEHMKGSMMSAETVGAVCRHIRMEMSGDCKPRLFRLSFFGGEPLLGFNDVVRPVIDAATGICRDNGVEMSVSLTTNGYLADEGVARYFKDIPVSFQITLDGHRPYHDRTRFPQHGGGSYDRILRNIELLASNGAHVIVRVNYTATNCVSLSELCDDLSALDGEALPRLTVNFQRVWQDTDDRGADIVGIVNKAMKKLNGCGIRCNSHLDMEMVSNSCYGDRRRYALVNYDGNVFRCTARDFRPESRCGVLLADGTIDWDMEYVARRMSAKMQRPQCVECRIAPLCGGGCRQKALEAPADAPCIHGYSEEEKTGRVLNRFESCFMNRAAT